jgi:hypothetical protein
VLNCRTMSNLPPEVLKAMKEEARRTGRLGGLARANQMTAKQRRESALKASRAAALARTKKAKQQKRKKDVK